MHQMTAEWERMTILNAEYALQTAASAIRRDVDEIDDLAGWCAYNPGMRTYLLTGDTASNQALSMYRQCPPSSTRCARWPTSSAFCSSTPRGGR